MAKKKKKMAEMQPKPKILLTTTATKHKDPEGTRLRDYDGGNTPRAKSTIDSLNSLACVKGEKSFKNKVLKK